MRIKQLFLTLALLCTVVQGAWAQANWEEVYAMTNTTTSDWAQLSGGSTTGRTLGAAGTTTYYYANSDLTFTNSNTGGSGLTIQGTVYLYLPQGVTVTCTGAHANGTTGAGAGIELAMGHALCLIGQGAVSATGGNAANGGNGGNGGNAGYDNSNYWSGTGGTGGSGGGGAGAGIGTRGGQGGQGGSGAANKTSAWSTDFGRCGSNGEAGATAAAMGELCVSTSFTNLTATGGSAATQGGSAGNAGMSAFYDGSNNYSAAGGGGGGGGGFGGAATGIGTGGPGGGGGGGGASSNLDWAASGYYVVKAPGGKGGQNVDGTWAAAGAESIMNHNAIKTGQVKINASGWEDDKWNYDSYVSSQGVGIGGSAGSCGNASISESAINITTKTALPTQEEWAVVCSQTNTSQSQWTALPFGTSMGATLGTAGTTTYYYATGDRTFINAKAGGSGLTIQGTVYLFVASGQTITCKGANAGGQTGAGAGIELTSDNSLFLLGQGNVNAIGGNAANGANGANGTDAGWDSNNYWSGTGGNGGNGGGGAGAGIGTRGGDGGQGGDGAANKTSAWSTSGGGSGAAGTAGATAGGMGELYVVQSFGSLSATGGAAASRGGSAGSAGKSILDDDTSNNYGAAGGGGGGGGGFGGAATGIGTGGPGGGGGGGGTSGNLDWTNKGYYVVKAPGGKGGQNVDGTWAGNGAESILNYNNLNNGQAYSNSSKWDNYDSYTSSQAVGTGGSGGAAGAASTSEQATTVNMKQPTQDEWDMVCRQTKTSQSQWRTLPLGVRKGATIGAAGTTTYYLATYDRSFTNSTVGGSGLTILGTVYLFISSGNQITCTGAHASGTTGAGAGVELTAGNTLYLIGSGKLVATGGNAANGINGQNGGDASFVDTSRKEWIRSGDGGNGGDGGGGAGAGIGTRGGTGGTGGAGGVGLKTFADTSGNVGSPGTNGGTAADMGTLYVYQRPAPTMEIHGGSGGTIVANGGTGGLNALCILQVETDISRNNRTMGGGAGGAGGGFGGAASDIGTGGPGGGGGGGGASGSIQFRRGTGSFYQVGALGGSPGVNGDGTLAGAGESTMINSDNTNVVSNRTVNDEGNLGWYNGDNRAAGGAGGGNGSASTSGTYYVVPTVIILADNADNSTTISDAHGYVADVTLQGRTLYKDGAWNTLCLPFNVTLAGSPLEGAVARPLTEGGISGTTLNLTFGEAVTELVAGTPYIIKWYGGDDIVSPVFSGVTIDATVHPYDSGEAGGDQRVRFTGTYSSMEFGETDNSILLMGGENMLYYPTTGAGLGAQHAYFKIGGNGAKARRITGFSIDFGDSETTGIISAEANSSLSDWYTIHGVKLDGKPTRSGIYINGGRKVVIK